MTISPKLIVPGSAGSSANYKHMVHAPSVDKLYEINSNDQVFCIDPYTWAISADTGSYSYSDTVDSQSHVFYRTPTQYGNTYGALYVAVFAFDAANELRVGTIDSADGETITWSDAVAYPVTTSVGDTAAYDQVNDVLYYVKQGASKLWRLDFSTMLWTDLGGSFTSSYPTLAVDRNTGLVYLMTGHFSDQANIALYSYTPNTGTWVTLTMSGIDPTTLDLDRSLTITQRHLVLTQYTSSAAPESQGIWTLPLEAPTIWAFEATSWGGVAKPPHAPMYSIWEGPYGNQDVIAGRRSYYDLLQLLDPHRHKEESGVLTVQSAISATGMVDTGTRFMHPAVLKGLSYADIPTVARVMDQVERAGVTRCIATTGVSRRSVLRCGAILSYERSSVLIGNNTELLTGVLRSSERIQRTGVLRTHPAVPPKYVLDAEFVRVTSIQPYEFDSSNSEPMFFNQVLVKYDRNAEGEYASSVLLRSPYSHNHYGETEAYTLELPYIVDSRTAIKVGSEYLIQHHIVPLLITINYQKNLWDLKTTDIIMLNASFGVSKNGNFENLVCRVKELKYDKYRNQDMQITLVSSDYMYLPPAVQTVEITQTGLKITTDVSTGSALRTFTILEASEGSKPIAGATVEISQTGDKNITDQYGKVSFVLAPGTYLLRVTSSGHQPNTFTEVVT